MKRITVLPSLRRLDSHGLLTDCATIAFGELKPNSTVIPDIKDTELGRYAFVVSGGLYVQPGSCLCVI